MSEFINEWRVYNVFPQAISADKKNYLEQLLQNIQIPCIFTGWIISKRYQI